MNNAPLDHEKAYPVIPGTGPWHILKEEVSLPVAVIQQAQLSSNIRWMQQFADHYGVKLAPHGKTTMAPEIHHQQIQGGSWGISLATTQQLLAAYRQGIKTLLMANQLTGKGNCEAILPILQDPEAMFYCFVDSVAQAQQLQTFCREANVSINVLIEMGVTGGRCGVRTTQDAEALADTLNGMPGLKLCGIGFYEGVIHGEQAQHDIIRFLDQIVTTFRSIRPLCSQSQPPLVTGAGSAWYDLVAQKLAPLTSEGVDVVLRPGCYVTFDAGIYADAQAQVECRSKVAASMPTLKNALQLWAYVQSVPESNLAIVGLGKRDAAFDAGLPVVERIWRPSQQRWLPLPTTPVLTHIMDQHAMLRYKDDVSVQVGDMIQFATSHPCLTFDKWRKLGVVKDDDTISHYIPTYF